MLLLLLLLAIDLDFTSPSSDIQYQYDEDSTQKPVSRVNEIEFEPVVNLKDRHIEDIENNINCEEFNTYALNCTLESAMIYNSSKKSPPMPAKIGSWCSALRHLTNCAIDWNSECKDVTESHFNEESIKGHMHVVNNICDDEWFLANYDLLPSCIDKVDNSWESCYIVFKSVVDFHKNATPEWTHYSTHFQLCCIKNPSSSTATWLTFHKSVAVWFYIHRNSKGLELLAGVSILLAFNIFHSARMSFRRCTLDSLFVASTSRCKHEHAIILQKFSVIVSEGDVFQECDHNVMYSNCPGGDPRPPSSVLSKLMNAEESVKLVNATSLAKSCCVLVFLICLIKFLM